MRPVVALTLLLVLAWAAPAGAVCRWQGPQPSAQQRAIDDAISSRAIWGLPRGRDLVRRLERDPAARRRGYARLDFPMTAREAAYFDDRTLVEEEARRVSTVAERIRGLSGGVSIEDDFPRGAHVRQRITRALTRAERRSFQRRARRVRTPRVEWSERRLRQLQDRVSDDRGLEALGIEWHSLGVDLDRNTVSIDFSSDRPDAEDVLRRRYGRKLTLTRYPALTAGCTRAAGYDIAADGVTLTVYFFTSGSDSGHRAEVREEAGRVLIDGVSDSPPIVTADARLSTAVVTLAAPLGSRKVVSITTRKPVRRGTPTFLEGDGR